MRASSDRPADVRRYSTSLTVTSNFAVGLYEVAAAAHVVHGRTLDIASGNPPPKSAIRLRNARRSRRWVFITSSCCVNLSRWRNYGGYRHRAVKKQECSHRPDRIGRTNRFGMGRSARAGQVVAKSDRRARRPLARRIGAGGIRTTVEIPEASKRSSPGRSRAGFQARAEEGGLSESENEQG